MAYVRLRMGSALQARESASDIAQSVCREVLQDMGDFEYQGDEAFRKWLFVQASHKLVDRHRYYSRQKRAVDREVAAVKRDSDDHESMLDCYATFCTPSRVVSARSELERLEQALQALPENQREAVALSKLMGFPTHEVAAHLECSESAVRGLIARGLAKLAIGLE